MSGREGQGLNVYRNIGQRLIYWLGQKVLVYDIWPKELLNYSSHRLWELTRASKLDTLRRDRVFLSRIS
jgi:hypothetical protein